MSTGGRGLVNMRHSRLCQGRLFHFFYDISTLVEAMEPRLDFKDPEEIIPTFNSDSAKPDDAVDIHLVCTGDAESAFIAM
jgi:hypothetical protein